MASVRVCGLLHGRVEQAHEEAQVGAEHAEPQTGSVRQAAPYNTRVCHNTRQAGEGVATRNQRCGATKIYVQNQNC